ncbi:MAG: hypothetical protein M3N50_08770 [Pseudomonadota bacterium]|nr:hypothetical protein [Pseudomonadota bacterium]
MLHYDRAVETKRPAGARRIEVFSPKIKRRLTLFSWDAHDAWLLLEADPTVRTFCERPAYLDGEAGRVLDFWVDQGGRSKFFVLSTEVSDAESLPSSVHGVKLQVLRRPDMIAFARRIENWAQILPYRTSFMRHTDRRLQNDLFACLEKPHRLERIEAAFHPIDVSTVRAALFDLLAEGRASAPDLDFAPLGLDTVFRRAAP